MLLVVFLALVLALPIAAAAALAEQCTTPTAAPRLEISDPESDLSAIEALSRTLGETFDGLCDGLSSFDSQRIARNLAPGGLFQRLSGRQLRSAISRRGSAADVVEYPRCLGDADAFVEDLEAWTSDWIRIDRCEIEPSRIFATRDAPHRVSLQLHFKLGGVDSAGVRIQESAISAAEAAEDEEGRWLLTRLEFLEGERYRSQGAAFTDQTLAAGMPTEWLEEGYDPTDIAHGQILYGGVAVADYDGDGWPDLYVTRSGSNLLLRNDRQGGFVDVTDKARVGDPGNSQAAVLADFDNDGDLDLFVVNAAYSLIQTAHSERPHTIYRNRGDGIFDAQPLSAAVAGPASGLAVADFDRDGLLDVYVTYYQDESIHPYHPYVEARDGLANRLYRNVGDLRFVDVTRSAGVAGSEWSFAASWADFDRDGWLDLYVANDFGDNVLYRNLGDGQFSEIGEPSGVSDPGNGMSVDWGDYDNDGWLDLYVSNMYSKSGNLFLPLTDVLDPRLKQKLVWGAAGNALYRNRGDGRFEETGRGLGVNRAGWAWSGNFFDYDNDGWLDLHVANGYWAGKLDADA